MRIIRFKRIAFASAVFISSLSPQTTSPFIGDWKVNAARSKSDQPIGDALLRIRKTLNGFEMTLQQIRTNGNPPPRIFPCVLDGKEHIFTFPDAKHRTHASTCKLINERTLERTVNHDNGKMVTTTKARISTDGKTIEEVWTGKTEQGKPIDLLYVFDKQWGAAGTTR
jgi:hypothetical protein